MRKKQKTTARNLLCGLLAAILLGASACGQPAQNPLGEELAFPENTEQVAINVYDAGITPHGTTAIGNDAVLDGETIYALTGATVTFVNAASGAAEKTITLAGLEPHMTDPCIFVGDGVISVIRTSFRQADGLLAVSAAGERLRALAQYDLDGALLREYDISGIGPHFFVRKLIVDGDAAYVLANEHENVVFRFNLKTNTLTQLETPMIGDMALAAPGELLLISDALRSTEKKIYRYNAATQAILWEKETVYSFNGIAVDTSTGMCYLHLGEDIYAFRYGKAENDVALLGRLTYGGSHGSSASVFSFFAGGDRLVLFERSGALKVCDNASGIWTVGDNVLYVFSETGASISDWEAEAISIMNERYPGFRIVYVDGGSELEISSDGLSATYTGMYTLNITNKLLANDKDFDMFCLQSANYMNILFAEYFEDLSQYPGIVKNFDAMLPGVKEVSTFNGKIYGIPDNLMFESLSYSRSEMEDLGVTMPNMFPTLDEYEAAMTMALEDMTETRRAIGDAYAADVLLSFMAEFLAAQNPDKAELAEVFAKIKGLCDKGLLTLDNNAPSGIFVENKGRPNNSDKLLMGTPRLYEDSGYAVRTMATLVNPSAANKALAIEYLEVLSSRECLERYYDASIAKDRPWMGEMSDAEIELESNFQYLYPREWLENTDNIRYEFQKKMLEKSVFAYFFDSTFVLEQFRLYADGSITLEAAVDTVYNRLMMIKNE